MLRSISKGSHFHWCVCLECNVIITTIQQLGPHKKREKFDWIVASARGWAGRGLQLWPSVSLVTVPSWLVRRCWKCLGPYKMFSPSDGRVNFSSVFHFINTQRYPWVFEIIGLDWMICFRYGARDQSDIGTFDSCKNWMENGICQQLMYRGGSS